MSLSLMLHVPVPGQESHIVNQYDQITDLIQSKLKLIFYFKNSDPDTQNYLTLQIGS